MLYLQLVVLRPVALAAGEAFLVVSQALLHDLLGLEDSPSAPRTSPPHAAGLRLFIHRTETMPTYQSFTYVHMVLSYLLLFMDILLLLAIVRGGLDARGIVVGLRPAVLGDLLEAVLAEEEALVDVAARRVEELVAQAALEAALVPSVVPCD